MSASRIAARVQRIKPSPSSAAADRAAELRRQGKHIVNLVVGEPDFDTPAHIRKAAFDAMERGETRYTATAGTPALRAAIAAKLQRENGLPYDPKDIIVTCGAKHAIFNALAITVEAGDEVLIPAPYWVSYPDMALACDGVPVVVPCTEEDGFKLTPALLEAAITSRTRWLIINSPTNPTGATYTGRELRALADVLLRHPNVLVMMDDIYEHIRFDSDATPHLLAIEPALASRTLVVNGVSKTYAMTGWRIGYVAGPADLIAALDTLQSQSTSNACTISQAAALAALTGDQTFVQESVQTYRARRDRALESLNAIPGISCKTPGGAFYLYVNCSGLIGRTTPQGERLEGDTDVVLYLLEQAGVALVAGSAYGVSPFFRMSIATSIDVIDEGCRKIADAVAALD
ncbi:aspartate aminotransferase [Trinickia symbiotica]|uniref:Aminotransferase n=1 Tax=Trinickia symbiotica TaxID=863227 RepID=A0A2N7WUW8_9BURK|nr:aspartate transaminase [Trinickia symbiotica]PMS33263.1 aspartate aminotransferase [Trinickia symbiotica]PPK42283.1 aspartate aminotransferase [Trinickia symbiotica]